MFYNLTELVDSSLKKHGRSTYITQGNYTFSYQDIYQLSLKWEQYFKQKNIVKGDIIGLISRVRYESIAAMFACLRLGIVYVPINLSAPKQWMAKVIEKTNIKLVILDLKFEEKIDSNNPLITIFTLSKDDSPSSDMLTLIAQDLEEAEEKYPQILTDDLAYILFTSGSTGFPKGIMISQKAAYTFIHWMQKEFKLKKSSKILSRAPLQFDLSVFDIFTTLYAGSNLIINSLEAKESPQSIVDFMREKKISHIYTVPSAFIGLLTKSDLKVNNIPTLKQVMYAGEPFPTNFLKKFMEALPQTRVSNIYGPTETNIVTYFHLNKPPVDNNPIPIGEVVHDTEFFIVDENMNQVKEGEIGELLIRGGTVFAGYFKDNERTEKTLVKSPFHVVPTYLCKTGDYARFEDGLIHYHGRKDSMVKSRGYRIEIGEIENALASISYITESAVVAKKHEKYQNTLHCYFSSSKEIGNDDLIQDLEKLIPEYMIPFEFLKLANFPKTTTGKIDRINLLERL